MPENELIQLFGFSASDLEYNRRGELSVSQRQRLRKRIFLWSLLALTVFVPFLFMGIGLMVNLAKDSRLLMFAAVIVVVLPLNAFFFIRHIWERYRDLMNNGVEQITGFVMIQPQKISTSRGTSTIYVLTVNWNTSFNVDEHVALNFPPGNYCLYYTPFSQTIVSGEAIKPVQSRAKVR
jgi:hypothetical protein